MSEAKNRVVPINESRMFSSRINVQIPFPSWVESDEIGIDVDKTLSLMNMGGIRNLKVRANESEGSYTALVTGIEVNQDGSVSAQRVIAREKTISVDHTNNTVERKVPFQNSIWTDTNLRLGIVDMQRKLEDEGKNLRRAKSWVPELNGSLGKGLRRAGTKHLMKDLDSERKRNAVIMNAPSTIFLIFNTIALLTNEQYSPETYAALTSTFLAFHFVMGNLLPLTRDMPDYKTGEGHRISLFPGYEFDRAALLQIASRTKKLVRQIHG